MRRGQLRGASRSATGCLGRELAPEGIVEDLLERARAEDQYQESDDSMNSTGVEREVRYQHPAGLPEPHPDHDL